MTRLGTIAVFLRSQNTLALATISESCAPRVTPLYYLAGDDLKLYWFSSRASEHSRSLRRNAQAAVAVYRPSQSWREIRGAQMRGRATEARDAAVRRAIEEAYARRFGLGRILRAALKKSTLYVFEPEWVRYVDNSRRLGAKLETRIG